MDTNRKKIITGMMVAMVSVGVCAGAVLATGGQNDPLITLSYLNDTVTPSLLQEAKNQATAEGVRLEGMMDTAIAQAEARIDQKIASSGGSTGGSTTTGSVSQFTVVTLAQGEVLQLPLGSEVLLRIGEVTVTAANSPALINTTTGASIYTGAKLETNHLYLATIEGHYISANVANTKVMFRSGS